jgi:hypothetical protein
MSGGERGEEEEEEEEEKERPISPCALRRFASHPHPPTPSSRFPLHGQSLSFGGESAREIGRDRARCIAPLDSVPAPPPLAPSHRPIRPI